MAPSARSSRAARAGSTTCATTPPPSPAPARRRARLAAGRRRAPLGRRPRLRRGRRLRAALGIAAAGAARLARAAPQPRSRRQLDHRLRARRRRHRSGRDQAAGRGADRDDRREQPAAARPEPDGRRRGARRASPRGLRGGRRRRRRPDPRGRGEEARARPRGHRRRPRRALGAGLFGALRELFESCFVFCVGTPEADFIGASPGAPRPPQPAAAPRPSRSPARPGAAPIPPSTITSASSCCAAPRTGTSTRSSRERIKRRLEPHSVWVEVAAEPVVIKVANIQHLATPIRAQLAESRSVLELAGLLHPTPGRRPRARRRGGLRAIAELEQLDRGWYAGPVGWMDMAEDGEFCVALRSALIRDRRAHLFAGAGIVADSDPGSRARRDRDQARRAAAAARRLSRLASARQGGGDGLADPRRDPAVQADVVLGVERHVDQDRAAGIGARGGELGRRPRSARSAARRPWRRPRSRAPEGVMKSRSKRSRLDLPGLRQELEDAAAAVVGDDELDRQAEVGEHRQAADVVAGREIAEQRPGRPSPAPRRGRTRSRRGRRSRSRRDWSRSGHRGRRRRRTTRRRGSACSRRAAPARPRRRRRRRRGRGRARSGRRSARELGLDRRRCGVVGAAPGAEPGRVAGLALAEARRRAPRRIRRGSPSISAPARRRRLVPAPGRADHDLVGPAGPVEPGAQGLARRHVAGAQHEIGLERLGRLAQDQVVVRRST